VRIEALHLLQRRARIFQNAGLDGHGCAQHASLDAPPPHPDFEALPLLGRSV
jgi:hypothetical protein